METKTSWQLVFEIPEVRELILDHVVVQNEDEEFEGLSKDIQNCRLVQKAWLDTVTSCLRKAKKPLFRIKLNKSNSVHGMSYVKQHGKFLSRFITHIQNQLRLSKAVPTFSLNVTELTLSQFNRNVAGPLLKCLEVGGNGLTKLILTLPREAELKSFKMQKLSFPRLVTLTLNLDWDFHRRYAAISSLETSDSVDKFIFLLLAGSSHLQELCLNGPKLPVPSGFECAALPASLRFLNIDCIMPLRVLRLYNQTVPMFNKGTKNSIFKSLDTLLLRLVDESLGKKYPLDIDQDIVASIHKAFPNLINLTLKISGVDITGIQHVFKFLTKLKVLSISVEFGFETFMNSDPWDALLLGIPIEVAKRLRENPDLSIEDVNEVGDIPSVLNLNDLEEQHLENNPKSHNWRLNGDSLISDAAFEYGFLKLPKLKCIYLTNQFEISIAMMRRCAEVDYPRIMYEIDINPPFIFYTKFFLLFIPTSKLTLFQRK